MGLSSIKPAESSHGSLEAGRDSFSALADPPQGSLEAGGDPFFTSECAPHGSLDAGADSFDASEGAPQGSEPDLGAAVAACSQRSGSVSPSFA